MLLYKKLKKLLEISKIIKTMGHLYDHFCFYIICSIWTLLSFFINFGNNIRIGMFISLFVYNFTIPLGN